MSAWKWVCDLCRHVNAPEHDFCASCHVGERRVSYANVGPRRFLLDTRLLDTLVVGRTNDDRYLYDR